MGSLLEVQKSLIVGSLLGDGYMRCKTNAHLQVTHSIRQKIYVDWKYQQLKDFVSTPPKEYQGNGNRVGYRFFTRSLPLFTPFYHRFYPHGKKIIPPDIQITPLTLAVWFMDDGSKSRNSCYLNTQQFHVDDQLILIGPNDLYQKGQRRQVLNSFLFQPASALLHYWHHVETRQKQKHREIFCF